MVFQLGAEEMAPSDSATSIHVFWWTLPDTSQMGQVLQSTSCIEFLQVVQISRLAKATPNHLPRTITIQTIQPRRFWLTRRRIQIFKETWRLCQGSQDVPRCVESHMIQYDSIDVTADIRGLFVHCWTMPMLNLKRCATSILDLKFTASSWTRTCMIWCAGPKLAQFLRRSKQFEQLHAKHRVQLAKAAWRPNGVWQMCCSYGMEFWDHVPVAWSSSSELAMLIQEHVLFFSSTMEREKGTCSYAKGSWEATFRVTDDFYNNITTHIYTHIYTQNHTYTTIHTQQYTHITIHT